MTQNRNSSGILSKIIEGAAMLGIFSYLCNMDKEEKPIQRPSLIPSFNSQVEERPSYNKDQNDSLYDKFISRFKIDPNYDYRNSFVPSPQTNEELRQNAPVFNY
jgi:hypothetical protein